MTRAVVDTNVLVSALINPGGAPAKALNLWHSGQFVLVVSEAILGELSRVLAQPRLRRYGLNPGRVATLLGDLRQFAIVVGETGEVGDVVRDPEDRKLLECAVAGRADYIVSGDEDLLSLGEHAGIPIISPATFLRVTANP